MKQGLHLSSKSSSTQNHMLKASTITKVGAEYTYKNAYIEAHK